MFDSTFDELLSVYLDGEATPDERAIVERLLESSAEARGRLQRLAGTSDLVRCLPRISAPTDLAAAIRAQTGNSQTSRIQTSQPQPGQTVEAISESFVAVATPPATLLPSVPAPSISVPAVSDPGFPNPRRRIGASISILATTAAVLVAAWVVVPYQTTKRGREADVLARRGDRGSFDVAHRDGERFAEPAGQPDPTLESLVAVSDAPRAGGFREGPLSRSLQEGAIPDGGMRNGLIRDGVIQEGKDRLGGYGGGVGSAPPGAPAGMGGAAARGGLERGGVGGAIAEHDYPAGAARETSHGARLAATAADKAPDGVPHIAAARMPEAGSAAAFGDGAQRSRSASQARRDVAARDRENSRRGLAYRAKDRAEPASEVTRSKNDEAESIGTVATRDSRAASERAKTFQTPGDVFRSAEAGPPGLLTNGTTGAFVVPLRYSIGQIVPYVSNVEGKVAVIEMRVVDVEDAVGSLRVLLEKNAVASVDALTVDSPTVEAKAAGVDEDFEMAEAKNEALRREKGAARPAPGAGAEGGKRVFAAAGDEGRRAGEVARQSGTSAREDLVAVYVEASPEQILAALEEMTGRDRPGLQATMLEPVALDGVGASGPGSGNAHLSYAGPNYATLSDPTAYRYSAAASNFGSYPNGSFFGRALAEGQFAGNDPSANFQKAFSNTWALSARSPDGALASERRQWNDAKGLTDGRSKGRSQTEKALGEQAGAAGTGKTPAGTVSSAPKNEAQVAKSPDRGAAATDEFRRESESFGGEAVAGNVRTFTLPREQEFVSELSRRLSRLSLNSGEGDGASSSANGNAPAIRNDVSLASDPTGSRSAGASGQGSGTDRRRLERLEDEGAKKFASSPQAGNSGTAKPDAAKSNAARWNSAKSDSAKGGSALTDAAPRAVDDRSSTRRGAKPDEPAGVPRPGGFTAPRSAGAVADQKSPRGGDPADKRGSSGAPKAASAPVATTTPQRSDSGVSSIPLPEAKPQIDAVPAPGASLRKATAPQTAAGLAKEGAKPEAPKLSDQKPFDQKPTSMKPSKPSGVSGSDRPLRAATNTKRDSLEEKEAAVLRDAEQSATPRAEASDGTSYVVPNVPLNSIQFRFSLGPQGRASTGPSGESPAAASPVAPAAGPAPAPVVPSAGAAAAGDGQKKSADAKQTDARSESQRGREPRGNVSKAPSAPPTGGAPSVRVLLLFQQSAPSTQATDAVPAAPRNAP